MQVSKIDNQHYRMCNDRKGRNRLENIERRIIPCISGQPHGRERPVAKLANDFVLTIVKQVAKMQG